MTETNAAALPTSITILYVGENAIKDITKRALETCVSNKELTLPSNDHVRARLFGDPDVNVVKHLRVIVGNTSTKVAEDQQCVVTTSASTFTHKVMFDTTRDSMRDAKAVLKTVHEKVRLLEGSMDVEYPEQLMTVMFLQRDCKGVLELGSNVGRNTLVIASLLGAEASQKLVTLESDPTTFRILLRNLQHNALALRAENAALSYRKLWQRGWRTVPSETKPGFGFRPVATTTFEALESKHGIVFDTIIADCEGALYHVLKDKSSILDNINTVVVENDYERPAQKTFVDQLMRQKRLMPVFSRSGGFGTCKSDSFYEVWMRI